MASDATLVKLASIAGITILEAIALIKGIDGALLATVFAFLGGIAGYQVKVAVEKRRAKK
ncbi:MAG: hypothetical protein DRJ44_03895 [Thermoprotei archaeon]|nr:MAG: hypothetical protein DRJ44_03895 [Thermoprotei archaeon]